MDNQNRKLELLGNAPIPKALLAMGIPTMIGMLINALYNLVDAYFVGGFQKEITVSRITEFNISHKRPPFLDLTELGRHQLVKLGIAWELVYKRHKGAANFE